MPRSRVTIEASGGAGIDTGRLRRLALSVLRQEQPGAVALTIRLTDDAELQRLNAEYRGVDAPTDVLSFAAREGPAFPGEAEAPEELGDIAISLESAARQASGHGWSLEEEVAHLVVHALLHLCGHDHEADPEALAALRLREERYLGPLPNVHANV